MKHRFWTILDRRCNVRTPPLILEHNCCDPLLTQNTCEISQTARDKYELVTSMSMSTLELDCVEWRAILLDPRTCPHRTFRVRDVAFGHSWCTKDADAAVCCKPAEGVLKPFLLILEYCTGGARMLFFKTLRDWIS